MQPFPHRYHVRAAGGVAGDLELTAERLPVLRSASPAEFGGPGDRWSPETLLVGAIADCFILTFRAIAAASRLTWNNIDVGVTGTLDRVDRVTRFTHFDVAVDLSVAPGADTERARQLLEKAERGCLISNSLKATIALEAAVSIAPALDIAS
jgi:organic hydroperoxide reductase OsmC/OhrA